jgi:shikimate dehydrogenase
MTASKRTIRLGLIGDNIRTSRSPALHRICGQLCDLDVRYDLFIPPDQGETFEAILAQMQKDGFAGTNVTLPYKERAAPMVRIADPMIARIGAVNTIRFGPDGPEGFNTDYSGFISAFRVAFTDLPPGKVALIGAGGVGKAVAFGLIALGATEIACIDQDLAKANTLAQSLAKCGGNRTKAYVAGMEAVAVADGVINCTPLGMVGYPGSPLGDGLIPANAWAFDAVYTPVETQFRAQAIAAGAQFLSGWELFFHQGVDAFEIFTGRRPTNMGQLRAMLLDPALSLAS